MARRRTEKILRGFEGGRRLIMKNWKKKFAAILVAACMASGICSSFVSAEEALLLQDSADNTFAFSEGTDELLSAGETVSIPSEETFEAEDFVPEEESLDGDMLSGDGLTVDEAASELLIEETDATVTVCNSHTQNLADITRTADILISAIGKPRFVTGDMVKPDTIIIDVGINRSEDNKLCGDVDAESFDMTPKFITPVPGGVGLLTRLSLLENVCDAYMLS